MNTLYGILEEFVGGVEILPMKKEDIKEIINVKYSFFKDNWKPRKSKTGKERHDAYSIKYLKDNWRTSFKVVDKNNKIIGGYIIARITFKFNPKLKYLYDVSRFYNKVGFRGVSLFLKKEYQGKGIGKNLITKLQNIADKANTFAIGGHFKSLENIKHWLKKRYLFLSLKKAYRTIYTKQKLINSCRRKIF